MSRGITIAICRGPSSSQPVELAIGTAAEAVVLVAVLAVLALAALAVLAAARCAGADLYTGCEPNQPLSQPPLEAAGWPCPL
jgi:hypothetical protein